MSQLIIYLKKKYESEITILFKEKIITEEFIVIMNLLQEPLYVDIIKKGEINVFIGDKTLSNSITLNMLYKYMIGVNKNTEGYYDRQMNIRSRIHRKKYIEEKSIIGDILPRTRYIIISLKYFGYISNNFVYLNIDMYNQYEFINLSKNKNFYLSYYEKTYSKTSLTLFNGTLRTNNKYGSEGESSLIAQISIEFKDKLFYYNVFKTCLENEIQREIILYFYTFDQRFFNKDIRERNNMLFSFFLGPLNICYLEEVYTYQYKNNLMENRNDLKIPIKFTGLSNYKLIFKIMGRIQLYEEEAIVGNKDLQNLLIEKFNFFENNLKKIEKDIIKLSNFYYYQFFFSKYINLIASDLEEDLIFKVNNLKNDIKTRLPLDEIMRFYIGKAEKDKIQLKNLSIARLKEIESTDLVEETIGILYLKHNPNIIVGLYLRMILNHYCYNRKFNNNITEEIIEDELIKKYDLYKFF